MTWVKLDDQFPDHPKVAEVGPLGGWLQVCGLAYCNRHLTDGFIPTAVAHRLADFKGIGVTTGGVEGLCEVGFDPTCEDVCNALVTVGMWSRVTGGYRIHDYDEYQPSKAEVMANRAKIRERVKRHRQRNAVTDTVSNTESNEVSNAAPVPVSKEPGVGLDNSGVRPRPVHVWQEHDEPPDFKHILPDLTPEEVPL